MRLMHSTNIVLPVWLPVRLFVSLPVCRPADPCVYLFLNDMCTFNCVFVSWCLLFGSLSTRIYEILRVL